MCLTDANVCTTITNISYEVIAGGRGGGDMTGGKSVSNGSAGIRYSRIVPDPGPINTSYAYLDQWDKEGGFGKVGGRSSRNKGHNKRNRDVCYSAGGDERHYRTHLFLTPPGACQGCVSCDEEASTPLQTAPSATATAPAPAPRRSSVTLLKWNVGSTKRKTSGGFGGRFDAPPTPDDRTTPASPTSVAAAVPLSAPSRQVNRLQGTKSGTAHGSGGSSDIAMLDRDCFIIPLHCLDRFLPEGISMPTPNTAKAGGSTAPVVGQTTVGQTTVGHATTTCSSSIRVLEVADPSLSVLLHLMTPLEPLEPLLESPLSSPYHQQGVAAGDLLAEVSRGNTNVHGMLLANMEKNSEFPYISYYVINKAQTDPKEFFRGLRNASLRKFDPRATRYTASHTLDLFNEVATIARPPFDPGYPASAISKRANPPSPSTGYIISFYKVFEGDDGEKFEKNWLYWTGARMLYRYLPKSIGLRRITLHKSISSGDKLYLLLCECSNFMDDLSAAAVLIPALRARLCGYTGIYRSAAVT